MSNEENNGIQQATIDAIGLVEATNEINARIAPNSRVFSYPQIENVYIMESDLYGNLMPSGSCFLAFEGRNGLIGQHITVDALVNSSVEEIRTLIAQNTEG